MAIFAASRGDGGNQCMPQAVTEPGAFAAIVEGVFAKDRCQAVTGCLSHQVDTKIACDPHTVSVPALTPVRRFIAGLLNASCGYRADDGIRPEGVENVSAQLVLLLGAGGLAGLHVHRARRQSYLVGWVVLRRRCGLRWLEVVPAPAPDCALTGTDKAIAKEHTSNTMRVRRIFIAKYSFNF